MPTAMSGPLAIFGHKRAAIGRSNQWIYPEQDRPRSDFYYDAWANLPEKTAMIPMRAVPPREGLWRRLFAYGANYAALEQPHLLRFVLVFA